MKSSISAEENSIEMDRLELVVQLRLRGRVREFRLLLYADGLVLQGRAATFHAKQLAQHAVMAATQLPILANDIEVGSVNLDSVRPDLSLV